MLIVAMPGLKRVFKEMIEESMRIDFSVIFLEGFMYLFILAKQTFAEGMQLPHWVEESTLTKNDKTIFESWQRQQVFFLLFHTYQK